MDIEFWRLSTSVQVVSGLLVAAFFVALSRSATSSPLRRWSHAWVANLAGLVIISGYWVFLPHSPATSFIAFTGYVFFKSTFVVLLVLACVGLADRPRKNWLVPLLGCVAILAVTAGALAASSFYYAATIQNAVIAVVLAGGAAYLLGHRLPRGRWLSAAMAVRALLALGELFGNLATWQQWTVIGKWHISTLMAASSSLDAASEWAIALASLLVFYEFVQRDLTRTNEVLQAAQRSMQEMMNHDQLTGLLNRRALPGIMAHARDEGASIVFFDIDAFKQINDNHGHDIGDACLQRFSAVLKESFRDRDQIVRYAGDEFIVFAPRLPPDALRARIDSVRQQLERRSAGTPAIRFSHGVISIPQGGDPDAALRDADHAMYANKATHRQAPDAGVVTRLRPAG